MGYSNIKQHGYWSETANTLNYNFNKIDAEINELNGKTTKSKGLFRTEVLLKNAYPSPEPGDWAFVGTSFPAQIWIEEEGEWVNSGGTGGNNEIALSGYINSEIVSSVVDSIE